MLLDFRFSLLPILLFVTFGVAVLFIHFWVRIYLQVVLLSDLPWAGTEGDQGIISRMMATFKSIGNTRNNIMEGYSKFSKKNMTYVLPNLITGPEVIIPMSQLPWLMKQPENVLNQGEVNRQFLQADYTMLHPSAVRDTVHLAVIRKEMTVKIEDANPEIVDELSAVFEEHWGNDTNNWKEIEVYETMLHVIGRISNRVLVGLPLCRNEEYLTAAKYFAQKVVLSASLINLTPVILRPVFGPLITLLDKRRYWAASKFSVPIILDRKAKLQRGDRENEPYDYIQWALRHAIAATCKNFDRTDAAADTISRRLAVISFGTIQSSVITITNTIFDLAASPFLPNYMTALDTEIKTELAKENGLWNKMALSKMTNIDSALRESMRIGGFISRGVIKMVMDPNGIILPNGIHVPKGIKIGVTQYSIHRDEDVYSNPTTYDAFRFSRPVYAEGEKRPVMVATSPTFMAFSHGPHCCPGRFFAANQLKLALAHIVLKYEIQPISSRPTNRWFADSIAPPMSEKIFIRRRKNMIS